MRYALILSFCALSGLACDTNQSGHIAAQGTGDLAYGVPTFAEFDTALRRECGSGDPTVLGNRELGRLPYLQSVTHRSARVLWTSESPGVLEMRPASTRAVAPAIAIAASVDATADPGVGHQWVTEATELQPGTMYCYRVENSQGEPWTDWTGFRTAPEPGQTFELSVLGDLGERSADQYALLDQLENLPNDLVLLTGDVGNPDGTLENFDENFFGVYSSMLGEVPFYPVSGNHDYLTDKGSVYLQVFSLPENGGRAAAERWYSFDWGDAHIVALDTEEIGATQAAWLEADLAEHASARWKIVILHRPPFSSGMHGDNEDVKEWFVPIFERAGVDLVLAGHDHDYERFVPIGGVSYVVTGGGGRGTRSVSSSDETAFAEDVIHLVHLRISPNELTGWAVDAIGRVFDTFQLTK